MMHGQKNIKLFNGVLLVFLSDYVT